MNTYQARRYGNRLDSVVVQALSIPAKRIPLSDDMEGLRFTVGRMIEKIHEDSADPLVVETTRMIADASIQKYTSEPVSDAFRNDVTIKGVWDFLRANSFYISDPTGKEVTISAVRMVRSLKRCPQVLEAIYGPVLGDAIRGARELPADQKIILGKIGIQSCFEMKDGRIVTARMSEDCDGLAQTTATMYKSVGIPVRLVMGGHSDFKGGCAFHHIWARVLGSEGWIDVDFTRPESSLGWSWPHFECVEQTEPM